MSSKHVVFRLALAIALACGITSYSRPVFAQETTADVVGTVTDSTGAIVPGATITLTNLGTQVTRQATSNGSGDYVFTLLKPGTYSLTITAPGFKTILVPTIALAVGDRNRENASLIPGAVTESVTVNATAPLMQRESSSITSVVTDQAVQDLPLNGRNFINLVQIQAGVNAGAPNAIASGNRPDDRRLPSTISANGQSDLYNNQLEDGVDNNEREQGVIGVRPSIDGISEVKVDTNNFSAEVGRDAGAVVNVITKSGANDFHGSLYEFFRNDIFDAREYFTRAGVTPKPEYRQNQFGGSVSGPIVKDRTFFFADAEDFRMVLGVPSGLLTVPTLYEQQNPGDFTDIHGPYIPPQLISPTGLAYFKLFPAPNVPGAVFNNYESAPNTTQNTLTADGRIDQHFRNGDQLYGRYSYNNTQTYVPGPFPAVTEDGLTVQPGGEILSYSGPSNQKAHGFILNYIHTFNPTTLLELKAGFTRLQFITSSLNSGKNVSQAFGVVNGNTPAAPETSGLTPADFLVGVSDPTNPTAGGGAYAILGDSPYLPIHDTNNTFQYQGSLTATRGTHTLKFGAEVIRRQLNYFQNPYGLGILPYVGLLGNPVEDMLAGYNFGYERNNTLVEQGFRMWEPSGYAEDDWRVTPNLTLNLGLRYDYYTPISEAHNNYANFDYPTLTLITGAMNKDVGLHARKGNVAPRFGFAQSIGRSTVLRGGFGISYYPTQSNLSIELANPPTSYASQCLSPACIGAPLPIPAPPSTTNLAGNLSYAPRNTNTSTLEMYNLALQHEFKGNALTIAYVGELGRHLLTEPIVNLPDPNGPYPNVGVSGPGLPPAYLTAASLPNVQVVQGFVPDATSNYNALQVIFARRFSHGLSFNSNYTYAHGLTDGLGGSGQGDTGFNYLPRDPAYNYGNSSNDVRHRVATSLTYQLPFGAASHGLTAALIKSWSVNIIDYWQTGLPFTVTDAFENPYSLAQINLPGIQSDRPDVVPGASFHVSHPTNLDYFNTAAFTPQPAGTAGNEHAFQLYGPFQQRADLSLFKSFDLPRQMFLQFRAEVYNISNTPNFANPNAVISNFTTPTGGAIPPTGLVPGDIPNQSGAFGEITGTNNPATNPRQMQFALKLMF